MDLLEYTQQLIKQGKNAEHAHKLQAILQNSSMETNKGENNSKHVLLIIVGAVVVVIDSMLVGYL